MISLGRLFDNFKFYSNCMTYHHKEVLTLVDTGSIRREAALWLIYYYTIVSRECNCMLAIMAISG